MAAAVVSGAAARILAARPRLSAQQVRRILEDGARDVPPVGPDPGSGAGAVDLAAALAAPTPPRGDPEPNDDPRVLATGTRPLPRGRRPRPRDRPRADRVVERPARRVRRRASAGQRLTARLRGSAAADLDLVLWRPGARGGRRGRAYARTWLASASLGPSASESIGHVASTGGRYTLEVQGVRAAADYTLTAGRAP